jgi:hypothetical protein
VGGKYPPYKQVALIISRLHTTWKNVCHAAEIQTIGSTKLPRPTYSYGMISFTLSQWCTKERLKHPYTKDLDPPMAHVFKVGSPVEDFFAVHLYDYPCTIQLVAMTINRVTMDRTL